MLSELVTGRIDAIRVVDEEPPPPGLTGVTEAQLARRRGREM
jgi:hypothetical protein